MKIKFKEEQRFRQWWLWTFIILFVVGIAAMILYQNFTGKEIGDNSISKLEFIKLSMGVLITVILLWTIKLKTEIDQKGIRFSFFPFSSKNILWEEIKKAEVLEYGFVGFGIRLWTKHGTVYNIKGNNGLAIELSNGKKILIGTQQKEELIELLKKTNLP